MRIINDTALHALANHEGGRTLFVGFGTSIGASLVADDVIVPVELGLVPFTKRHRFMTRLTKQDGIVGARRLWEGADYLAVPYGTTWRISKDGAPPASRAIASSKPARKLRTIG